MKRQQEEEERKRENINGDNDDLMWRHYIVLQYRVCTFIMQLMVYNIMKLASQLAHWHDNIADDVGIYNNETLAITVDIYTGGLWLIMFQAADCRVMVWPCKVRRGEGWRRGEE